MMTDPSSETSYRYASPRYHVSRPYELSHGPRVSEYAKRAGYSLTEWQRDVLTDWGAVGESGKFVHRRCGLSVPRQAGKSVSCVVWAGYAADEMGLQVLYTAHNYATTCEMLHRFRDIYGKRANDPQARRKRFNNRIGSCENKTAQEAMFFKRGGSIHFSTRTKSAALGFSFDLVVIDEAQELTEEQMQAIAPTTTSGPAKNPQVVFIGTPPRPGSPGDVFEGIRTDALSGGGKASDLSWWEWGASEIGDVDDERRWPLYNPSLGEVATYDGVRLGMRALRTDLTKAQEYLGYWLPHGHVEPAVDAEAFDALEVPLDERPRGAKRSLGVKFSADGLEVAVAEALLPDDGPAWVCLRGIERMDSGGMAWAAGMLRSHADDVAAVAIDGKSGSQELHDRVADSYPRRAVLPMSPRDAIAAASTMVNAVREARVRWSGPDGNLRDSVHSSPRRAIGPSGGWGFGGDDPTPVEAVAAALWAVENTRRDQRVEQEIW